MKKLILLIIALFMIDVVNAMTCQDTMTIQSPAQSSEDFQIIITAQSTPLWGASIFMNVNGGCKFLPELKTTYNNIMFSPDGNSKTINIKAPDSGTCIFTGDYKYGTCDIKEFDQFNVNIIQQNCIDGELKQGTQCLICNNNEYIKDDSKCSSEESCNNLGKCASSLNVGMINITSTPNNAQVYINGKLNGTTPLLMLNLSQGDYEIKISKSGYKDNTILFKINPGDLIKYNFLLKLISQPIPGNLKIISKPEEADIYLNNELQGTTDEEGILEINGLDSGKYLINISKEGYITKSSKITITEGANIIKRIKLSTTQEDPNLELSYINVTSNLSADVYLDNVYKGKTPLEIEVNLGNLSSKNYTVKLTKQGYQDYENYLTLTQGQTTEINPNLISEEKEDSDNDGLPDEWELIYFNNLEQGPNDDYDKDNIINLDEFKEGKNPTEKDEIKESDPTFLIIGIVIALVIISFLIKKYIPKKKIVIDDKHYVTDKKSYNINPSNSNPYLISYIRTALKQGYNKQQIKDVLLKKRWKEEDIEKAFDSI
jgi:hypothetical protein